MSELPTSAPEHGLSKTDRRKFLARNIAALGAIAATALVKHPASARECQTNWGPRSRHSTCNCFLAGTTIRTVDGPRPIEDLAVGDLLPTLFGDAQPIKWISRYVYRKSDPAKPWADSARPVRIARSAIAPNVPDADLYLTGWHLLYLDGVLAPVGNLINGGSIALADAEDRDELVYFHIKLEKHSVIFAHGAPCETLLEVTEAAGDYADYRRAHGESAQDDACAPLVYYEGRRGMMRSRIRSALSPWYDRRHKLDIIRDRLEARSDELMERLAPK